MRSANDTPSYIKILKSGEKFPRAPTSKSELVNVSLHGLNLPEDSVTKLKSEIIEVIKEEIERNEQNKPRQNSKTKTFQGSKKWIKLSLEGLNLPNSSTRRVKSQIENVITTRISKNDLTKLGTHPIETSVCTCAVVGGPGWRLDMSPLPPRTPPFPKVIAVYPSIYTNDGIRMEILDPNLYPVQRDSIWVSLASERNITWQKELKLWNMCNRGTGPTILYTRDNNHGGLNNGTIISKSTCSAGTDTLVFAKAQMFGAVGDVGYFSTSQFWTYLGGSRIHFTWVFD